MPVGATVIEFEVNKEINAYKEIRKTETSFQYLSIGCAILRLVPLVNTGRKHVCFSVVCSTLKLDGVGHVDNRPSTDYLHHFVPKKN